MDSNEQSTKCDVGKIDRIVRVVIGLALLGFPLAWYGLDYVSNWGFLGLIPLLTGLLGVCPLYRLLGISTCERRA